MAAARWHPEAPKQTEQLGVSGHASSVSSRAGPEHRGVTEHVSPGCSATGPQQSGQKQRGDPEHVVSDLREQLEKSGAAEHAPPESSKICPVAKSAGNAASTPDAGPAKKARTDTPEIVPSSRTQLSWAQLGQRAIALPQSAGDVMELRRLGPDLFEATKRSGELWVGDFELLKTLPQGTAKLGTLQVQELMRDRKAKAAREHNAVGAISSGGKSAEPPAKKQRTLRETFARRDLGAAEHADHTEVVEATSQDEPSCEIRPVAAVAQDVPWLFREGTGQDHVLLEWLRAREAQPRCINLLKQVLEWNNHLHKNAARKLYIAQGITIPRTARGANELILEAVRKHFREVISQERGRFATLNFVRHPLFL